MDSFIRCATNTLLTLKRVGFQLGLSTVAKTQNFLFQTSHMRDTPVFTQIILMVWLNYYLGGGKPPSFIKTRLPTEILGVDTSSRPFL